MDWKNVVESLWPNVEKEWLEDKIERGYNRVLQLYQTLYGRELNVSNLESTMSLITTYRKCPLRLRDPNWSVISSESIEYPTQIAYYEITELLLPQLNNFLSTNYYPPRTELYKILKFRKQPITLRNVVPKDLRDVPATSVDSIYLSGETDLPSLLHEFIHYLIRKKQLPVRKNEALEEAIAQNIPERIIRNLKREEIAYIQVLYDRNSFRPPAFDSLDARVAYSILCSNSSLSKDDYGRIKRFLLPLFAKESDIDRIKTELELWHEFGRAMWLDNGYILKVGREQRDKFIRSSIMKQVSSKNDGYYSSEGLASRFAKEINPIALDPTTDTNLDDLNIWQKIFYGHHIKSQMKLGVSATQAYAGIIKLDENEVKNLSEIMNLIELKG